MFIVQFNGEEWQQKSNVRFIDKFSLLAVFFPSIFTYSESSHQWDEKYCEDNEVDEDGLCCKASGRSTTPRCSKPIFCNIALVIRN